MKKVISLIFLVLIVSCIFDSSEDEKNNQNQSVPEVVDLGPTDDEHDICIAMSYSDPQPMDENLKHFYILVTASEGSPQDIENVTVEIQGKNIEMEYADYGKDFYIAYFYEEYAHTYSYKITVDGKTVESEITVPNEMFINFPNELIEGDSVYISWTTEKNPQVIYLEAHQQKLDWTVIGGSGTNFAPSERNFTIPAEWLWSVESGVEQRVIQMGQYNYTLKDRFYFTISDSPFRVY
ncbi:MAG: hypothetical protein JXR48_03815 [Candidatus Delongbacteria bacterium]|nr:hypothetical protein [Candidatus Delongbacteria bacterium]MBN2834073.1 hypothetical protein [Candidatus Delongbacteria bacterium]